MDSSISKTANVPTDYPYEDFKDIYTYAHAQGLKGCTTFRFNPAAFQGVLVKEADLENTTYRFELEDGRLKINPLADWSEDAVWTYLRAHRVPWNALHDRGYPSIGCAPCTRAVQPGEDVRAGRWWWENPESKECGLHVVDGKLIRIKSVAA